MRQPTLTEALNEQFAADLNSLCTIEARATGDTNVPGWSAAASAVACSIQQLSAEQRVAQAPEYDQRPTHQAFLLEHEDLRIGYRLSQTHQRDQYGAMQAAATPHKFQILGKDIISGERGQVRLVLSQVA